jgi:hypothetical protein
MIFRNIETKIEIGKEINSALGRLWSLAPVEQTTQPALLDRLQLAKVAQATPQTGEAGP